MPGIALITGLGSGGNCYSDSSSRFFRGLWVVSFTNYRTNPTIYKFKLYYQKNTVQNMS